MTMLTHTRVPFERVPYSSGRRDAARAEVAQAQLATIKRFCVCALTVVLAGGALAAIIALKAAVYFLRFSYH
ncbi:MAG TPA: hypothetical protein VNN81_13570 [Bradyrhizobium sp.]|jgi:hypothetical protein|nr:hypothetical protein [Bradyrhizobium sp.]